MNDPDTWPAGIADDLPEHLWAPLGLTAEEEPLRVNPTGNLVSLAYLGDALKRAKRIWCTAAVLGLLVGCGLYVVYPPGYHAKASVLLVDGAGQTPEVEVQTDQSLAVSQPVAANVVRDLGLQQSPSQFQSTYTVAAVALTVLQFNASAPSGAEAVKRAAALASEFLKYRANYEQTQQQEQAAQLKGQYNAAEKSLEAIDQEIRQLPTTGLTVAQQTQLDKLQVEANSQAQIMQNTSGTLAASETATKAQVSGSYVLDSATLLPHSRVKSAVLYVFGGLFGGLAIGTALVVIAALMSDRLRRRDDIAIALGVPVKLSVGSLRAPRRWLPAWRRRTGERDRSKRWLAAYLLSAVSGSPHGPASLAVVAVDDAQAVASVVAGLARSQAEQGSRVVLADLSAGRVLAGLFGVKNQGVHPVTYDGVNFLVTLPETDALAPAGPLHSGSVSATWTSPDAAVVSAYASADLLLTLVTLDPAIGGDHLATWASEAVAVVTAGRSSAEQVHSAGEMIRLAKVRFNSAALIGADRSDATLGLLHPDSLPAGIAGGSQA